MSDVETWSNTAGGNNASPPDGFPEGQSAASYNNAAREMMAALKRAYEEDEFRNLVYGKTVSRDAADTIRIAATDATGFFTTDARVKISSSVSAEVYGFVRTSTFGDPDTTVEIDVDAGATIPADANEIRVSSVRNVRRFAYRDTTTERINVLDFGAVGDGSTDDTAAITQAILAVRGTGKTLYFPSTANYYKVTGGFVVFDCVIEGEGCFNPDLPLLSSCIGNTSTSTATFTVTGGVTFRGLTFYRPTQVTTATPTVFQEEIDVFLLSTPVKGTAVEGCTFVNVTAGVRFRGASANRPIPGFVRNCIGYATDYLFRVNSNDAPIAFENCRFTPEIWIDSESTHIRGTIAETANMFEFAGTAAQVQISSCYAQGANAFIDVSGDLAKLVLDAPVVDECRYGIYVSGAGAIAHGVVTGGRISAVQPFDDATHGKTTLLDCAGLKIDNTSTAENRIDFHGTEFGETNGHHVQVDDNANTGTGHVAFHGCTFIDAGRDDAGSTEYYGIYAESAPSMSFAAHGCTFINTLAPTERYAVELVDAGPSKVMGCEFHSFERAVRVTAADRLWVSDNNEPASAAGSTQSIEITAVTNELRCTRNQWDNPVASTFASAATIARPNEVDEEIPIGLTGTTAVTSITATRLGDRITLFGSDANTRNITDGSNLKLAGTFSLGQDETMHLVCDGTNWLELSRSNN